MLAPEISTITFLQLTLDLFIDIKNNICYRCVDYKLYNFIDEILSDYQTIEGYCLPLVVIRKILDIIDLNSIENKDYQIG